MTEPKQMIEQRFLDHIYEGYLAGQRYCFILGAGASKTSGIRTGEELMREWREFLLRRGKDYVDNCAQDLGMEPAHYAHLFNEKEPLRNDDYFTLFDLRYAGNPNAAYAFLEKEMEKAFPSCGYYPLAMLLAHTENRLVITTNFDSLVEDALYTYTATRPLAVGHESLAPYMENDTRRPVIAKVHRDLLLQPMNREEEMQRLAEEWERPLSNALQKYIPIVIGYAGGDHTLMALLPKLQLKGLYWCYRDEVKEQNIRELVAKQNGYLVKIQGFDEIMFLLGQQFEKEAEIHNVKEVKKFLVDQAEKRGSLYEKRITAIQQKYEPQKNEDAPAIPSRDADNLGSIFRAIETYTGPQTGEQGEDDGGQEYAMEARMAFLKGDYQQAYDLYSQAIEQAPETADYYDRRSTVLYKMGRYEEALQDENKAIEQDENEAGYYHGRAVILHAMKRYKQALTDRDKAIELGPPKSIYWEQRGLTLYEMGQYEEALENCNQAIKMDPENAEYYDTRSMTLYKMGRYEEALTDSNEAIKLDSENAKYYNRRGTILYEMGRYEEALANVNQAIKLNPGNAIYYDNRSATFYRMGRYEEALTDSNKAVKLDSGDAEYYNRRGAILYKMGRYEEALADSNEAIKLDSGNAIFYDNRSAIFLKMEQYTAALADSNRAIELDSNKFRFYRRRARVLRTLDREEEAKADEEKANQLENS